MGLALNVMPFSWCVVLVNVGANFVGFFVVQLLLHYSQPVRAWEGVAIIEPRTTMLLLALLVPAAVLILVVLASPVTKVIPLLEQGREVEAEMLRAARKRVINLPFQAALMNLVAWILPAVVFPVVLALQGDLPPSKTGLYILYSFTNAFMITLLAFVLLQYACRKTAIPVLFPGGHLRDQKGTLRLGIRARLMILYGAICLIPMLQTVLVFNVGGSSASALVAPVDRPDQSVDILDDSLCVRRRLRALARRVVLEKHVGAHRRDHGAHQTSQGRRL